MKTRQITAIGAIVISGLLAYTNPKIDDYEHFIHKQIIEKTSNEDGFIQVMGTLFSGLASNFVAKSTIRNDYIFFSIYDTNFGKDKLRSIGLFNNFFIIKLPQELLRQSSQPKHSAKTNVPPTSQSLSQDTLSNNSYQKQVVNNSFSAGPIVVTAIQILTRQIDRAFMS